MANRQPGGSTLFPDGQVREEYGNYWGAYATAAELPNASGNVLVLADFVLEAGDTGFVTGVGAFTCTSAGAAGAGDAVWTQTGAGHIQGTIAHDDPNNTATNFPVLVGGVGTDQAPVLVSAVLDMVQEYSDRAGRAQVNQELSIAGENIVINVLRTVRGKLSVEQESWDRYNSVYNVNEPAAGKLIKTGAGRIAEVHILNSDAVQYYVWIINAVTGLNTAMIDRAILPASGEVRVDYSEQDGLYCDTGIFILLSTTLNAITLPGGASGQYHIAFA